MNHLQRSPLEDVHDEPLRFHADLFIERLEAVPHVSDALLDVFIVVPSVFE